MSIQTLKDTPQMPKVSRWISIKQIPDVGVKLWPGHCYMIELWDGMERQCFMTADVGMIGNGSFAATTRAWITSGVVLCLPQSV